MSEKCCSTCKYQAVFGHNAPCADCYISSINKEPTEWKPAESETADISKNNNYDQHYISAHQPIEVMQANMTHDEFMGFLKGNIIKYVCRLGKKDEPAKEAAKIRRYAEWLEQAISGQTVDPRK